MKLVSKIKSIRSKIRSKIYQKRARKAVNKKPPYTNKDREDIYLGFLDSLTLIEGIENEWDEE